MGRPLTPVELTKTERSDLERWARSNSVSHRLVVRARIILACAEGKGPGDVSSQVGVSVGSVSKTHSAPEIQRWLKRHKRFHFHFIPTYSSWLNQVERWFALLTARAIKRGVHRSTKELERAIREFVDHHNEDPKPFVWTKGADQIINAVQRHCQTLLDLHEDK